MKCIEIKTISIFILSLMIIMSFQKCSFLNSKKVTVTQQNLIFDTIINQSNKFDVNLYTILEFNLKTIKEKDYNNFLIIVNLDTFPLIVKQKFIKKEKDDKFRIKYFSPLKLESDVYENDSLKNLILNFSKIIKNKRIVERADYYNFQSLITIPNRLQNRFDM